MKQNKNSYFSYIVIISVVAIVAIVVLTMNGGNQLQGAATHIKHVETFESTCVDDDPENNYDLPGVVQQRSLQYLDYCSGNTLVQRYCATGGKIGVTSGYRCPNRCSSGACI